MDTALTEAGAIAALPAELRDTARDLIRRGSIKPARSSAAGSLYSVSLLRTAASVEVEEERRLASGEHRVFLTAPGVRRSNGAHIAPVRAFSRA